MGTKLPTELELSRAFGVSRASVREALGALQFMGYIESVRGSGSRVIATRRTPGGPGTARTRQVGSEELTVLGQQPDVDEQAIARIKQATQHGPAFTGAAPLRAPTGRTSDTESTR